MAKVIKNYESLTTKIGLLICLLVTIVTLSLIFLFKYADYIEKEEKNILLTEYNRKILELSKKEINKVFYHLSASFENPEISIKINDRTLNACYQGRCHKYNLLSFAKLLQLSIPEFIDFKIMLNNNVMDFRNHHTQYEKENSYKLNENYKIFINTFVDKEFWDKRKSLIKKPYWIIGITLILNSVALYLIFRYLFKI